MFYNRVTGVQPQRSSFIFCKLVSQRRRSDAVNRSPFPSLAWGRTNASQRCNAQFTRDLYYKPHRSGRIRHLLISAEDVNAGCHNTAVLFVLTLQRYITLLLKRC